MESPKQSSRIQEAYPAHPLEGNHRYRYRQHCSLGAALARRRSYRADAGENTYWQASVCHRYRHDRADSFFGKDTTRLDDRLDPEPDGLSHRAWSDVECQARMFLPQLSRD